VTPTHSYSLRQFLTKMNAGINDPNRSDNRSAKHIKELSSNPP